MQRAGKIAFIGGGNMAEALIRGLLRGTYPAAQIVVSEPAELRRDTLAQRYGVEAISDNREAVRLADLVILAIKPQMVGEVVGEVADLFVGSKWLVSILAGVSTAALEEQFD
ncbi:MAG: NAD(P)-binding domain-containing protein, partial [Desulfuromonadales bacterium]|nr:NAD(P)-binding domain-containing protein [Desulfuromonadales bacterium]